MSSEDVSTMAKDAWKSVKEALEKAQQAVDKELHKAAPVVQKSLDNSLETASKAFSSTMNTIDSRTESEQLGLLRAYKRFLSGQVEYVESKLKALEERSETRKQKPS